MDESYFGGRHKGNRGRGVGEYQTFILSPVTMSRKRSIIPGLSQSFFISLLRMYVFATSPESLYLTNYQ